MKVIYTGCPYYIKKKFSDIKIPEVRHSDQAFFVMSDHSLKEVEIYEYHGSLKHDNFIIVYGHEQIKIYSDEGIELKSEYTR